MPDEIKNDADLVNEPAENTAEAEPENELEEIEDDAETEGEEVEEFFYDNPLVALIHSLLSGHKVKNDDGSYTIKVADEHMEAAHDALADATKTQMVDDPS